MSMLAGLDNLLSSSSYSWAPSMYIYSKGYTSSGKLTTRLICFNWVGVIVVLIPLFFNKSVIMISVSAVSMLSKLSLFCTACSLVNIVELNCQMISSYVGLIPLLSVILIYRKFIVSINTVISIVWSWFQRCFVFAFLFLFGVALRCWFSHCNRGVE